MLYEEIFLYIEISSDNFFLLRFYISLIKFQMFFDCFMNRINKTIGSKKRKFIQEAQTFIRKDAVPLGKFTKYTWKLTSLNHVREIFSNSEIPLQITRYFSLQKDGTYKPCKVPESPADNDINSQTGTQPIKPREYKTILKVGVSCPTISREVTPFVIEWIPDILPLSEIGELRFRFEFDHYCNGQLVVRNSPTILVSKHPTRKSLGPPLAPRPSQNKSLPTLTSSDTSLLSIPINSDNLSAGESITFLAF